MGLQRLYHRLIVLRRNLNLVMHKILRKFFLDQKKRVNRQLNDKNFKNLSYLWTKKALKDGYIYNAPVNVEEEMVEMLEASRQYQNNVEVVSTLRALMMRTLNMGK